jgi:hypothetical protein
MSDRSIWLIRYIVVLVLAVILGATLGEMSLFKTTKLAKGLNAGHFVQFLGYSGALLVFWLLARRVETVLDGKDPRWNAIKCILVPLATLIVVACGQAVLLLVLGPLMNRTWQHGYNLVAIAAIILSVVWLLAALLTGSSSLVPLFGKRLRARGS